MNYKHITILNLFIILKSNAKIKVRQNGLNPKYKNDFSQKHSTTQLLDSRSTNTIKNEKEYTPIAQSPPKLVSKKRDNQRNVYSPFTRHKSHPLETKSIP